MSSNLPPGVTDDMIPGNRPEDEEIELTIVLTRGDIDDIVNFEHDNYEMIWDDIKDQIRDRFEDERYC